MNRWDQLASQESIDKAIEVLKANGIDAKFVQTGEEAKKEVFSMIPQGAEVMTMSSTTLDTLGITQEVQESGKYTAVKNKLNSMDKTQVLEKKKLGAAPEWSLGSVHAATEEGHVLIASNSGSQLPAYAYGSAHVIWVVGVQKIVKNTDDGIKRIYEYVLPLEDERAKKAYGMGSGVSKLLIINKEVKPNRITLIFVGEKLGF